MDYCVLVPINVRRLYSPGSVIITVISYRGHINTL